MPLEHFLLLSLAGPPQSSSTSAPGDPVRCLNSVGRWAVHGTARAPLLAWHSTQANDADAAADRVTKARRQSVQVVSRDASDTAPGREVQWFSEACAPALGGPAAQSGAKARRLRTEADKLEAFCVVVRAASAATDHHAFGAVSRAATQALRTKFGGGTVTSVFAWLTGPAGQAALESVLTGEVELAGPLSIRQVVEATALAQQAEQLQPDH